MAWTIATHSLPLDSPLSISRDTTTEAGVVSVELEADGLIGIGGCAPSSYYGETVSTVQSRLPALLDLWRSHESIHHLVELERQLSEAAPEAPAARAAVSTAAHDLAASALEVPLYRYWGLDPAAIPPTTVTIGIDDAVEMATEAALRAASGYGRLKLKLDGDHPVETVQTVHERVPDATLFVDVNGAWDVETATSVIPRLEGMGVRLVEQPVPGDDIEALAAVHRSSPLPIVADEACLTAPDIPSLASACDGVVLKLMKCGGLGPAWELLHTARAHGLFVMAGCMVESNASIAPACHLGPALDYVDLDGALLLEEDPYGGIPIEGDRFDLAAVMAGSGAYPV